MSHVSGSFRQTLKPTAINLGITFHSQLNFTTHVNRLIKFSYFPDLERCLHVFVSLCLENKMLSLVP